VAVPEWFSVRNGSAPGTENVRGTVRAREVGASPHGPLPTPRLLPSPFGYSVGDKSMAGGGCGREQAARLALSPQVLFPHLPPTPPTFFQLLVLLFPPTQQL